VTLFVIFYPYHFVHAILYNFVRYHFVLEPIATLSRITSRGTRYITQSGIYTNRILETIQGHFILCYSRGTSFITQTGINADWILEAIQLTISSVIGKVGDL